MPACLCCSKKMPVTLEKRCPECGHAFKGSGWGGMDAHWKAHHEGLMSYQEFRDGLCETHRKGEGGAAFAPTPKPSAGPPLSEDTRKALSLRSSHIENVLTHALIAKIAQELWRRDPWMDFQVFKADVDDAGFDLVLGCKGTMRYIQIKQTHLQGNAVKYSVRLDFAQMVGACAVVMVYKGDTLEIDHCLFFGGTPGEPMSSIEDHHASKLPGRRTADGARKVRKHYRDVPRRAFQRLPEIGDLVDRLFPICSDNEP